MAPADIVTSKTCKKCGNQRPLTGRCIICTRETKRRYKTTEKGRKAEAQYRSNNIEQIKQMQAQYRKQMTDAVRDRRSAVKREINSRPDQKQKRREYLNRPEVRERVNALRAKRYHQRYRSDLAFQADAKLRGLIRRSVKTGKQYRSWTDCVNFTLDQFIEHMQRQFADGMNWEEFQAGRIHIDHIVPVAEFSIKEIGDAEFMACWNLSNLRPLWAKENIKKKQKRVFLL